MIQSLHMAARPGSDAFVHTISQIAAALRKYPYCVHLTGLDTSAAQRPLVDIAEALAAHCGPEPAFTQGHGAAGAKKVSFTRVHIDPETAYKSKAVTAYSRTHLPLPPHTDTSYAAIPHAFVAFQCVIEDPEGGDNSVVPVDHVLSYLDAQTVAVLKEAIFPFGKESFPILNETGQGLEIRYYRAQIDQACGAGATLSETAKAAINKLDELLARSSVQLPLRLGEGEALLLHNRKALHARTGFAPDSPRLLHRVRHHVNFDKIHEENNISIWNKIKLFFYNDKKSLSPPVAPMAEKPFAALQDARVYGDSSQPPDLDEQALAKLADAAGRSAHDAEQYALELAMRGRFHEAEEGVTQAFTKAFVTPVLVQLAAALADNRGDRKARLAHQRTLADLEPISMAPAGTAPVLLQPHGLSGGGYSFQKRSGRFITRFEGGHFSLKDFVPKGSYRFSHVNLFDPALAADLPDLPPHDLVLNNIACADRAKPALEALAWLLARAEQRGQARPIINAPTKVLRTTREENYGRLGTLDDVVFPVTVRLPAERVQAGSLAVRAQMEASGLEFPVIIRPVGTHTGSGVMLLSGERELALYLAGAEAEQDYYLIAYHALADERGLYTKIRVFAIDGTFMPIACLGHHAWNVHSGDRYAVMDKNAFLREREQAFLADMPGFLGARGMKALKAIHNLIDLDFYGIDCMPLPDGRLFVFECNPAMRHNFDHAGAFPYTRPTLEVASQAFAAMIRNRLNA